MSANDIQSPTGLELHPRPPQPVRLSKRAGVLFVLIVGVVLAALGYGLYSRQHGRAISVLGPEDDRSVIAATDAGRRIAQDVPAKSISAAPEDTGHAEGSNEVQMPTALNADRSHQDPASIRSGGSAIPTASPAYQSVPQASYREATPEQKQLQLQYQRQQEAIAAPASMGQGFAGYTRSAPGSQSPGDLTQLLSLIQGLQRPNGVGAPVATSQGSDTIGEQNTQDHKETFLAEARRKEPNDYLVSRRMPPLGLYEIKAGWDIPAVLEQTINSDLPGDIRALVRENVYDTASGRWLLIPQGARLLGVYNSRIAYGQNAIQAVWNRIIFPDASSINLEAMIGQDIQGASGFRDDVDNHYRRLVGFGLLTSTFSAAFQLSQSRRGGVLGYPSPAETAGTAVGQELSQLGADVTRRNLNVQPTVKIHAGYRFNVRVNRDIEFEGPYQPISLEPKASGSP